MMIRPHHCTLGTAFLLFSYILIPATASSIVIRRPIDPARAHPVRHAQNIPLYAESRRLDSTMNSMTRGTYAAPSSPSHRERRKLYFGPGSYDDENGVGALKGPEPEFPYPYESLTGVTLSTPTLSTTGRVQSVSWSPTAAAESERSPQNVFGEGAGGGLESVPLQLPPGTPKLKNRTSPALSRPKETMALQSFPSSKLGLLSEERRSPATLGQGPDPSIFVGLFLMSLLTLATWMSQARDEYWRQTSGPAHKKDPTGDGWGRSFGTGPQFRQSPWSEGRPPFPPPGLFGRRRWTRYGY